MTGDAYISSQNLIGKKLLERPSFSGYDNIKVDIKDML
jgi:hypothetical protein